MSAQQRTLAALSSLVLCKMDGVEMSREDHYPEAVVFKLGLICALILGKTAAPHRTTCNLDCASSCSGKLG